LTSAKTSYRLKEYKKKGKVMNQPLEWILNELQFGKNSGELSKEVNQYCAMLQEGLLHNINKAEITN